MRCIYLLLLLFLMLRFPAAGQDAKTPARDKTTFQIADPWNADYDIRSDVVMVYGMNDSFADRVKGWKERGYGIQFMTGIAWGEYQDYFEGRFDGKMHPEEGQQERNGETIGHGRGIPYVVPTAGYLRYIETLIKKAIDGGVTAIYLEEPEFWARAGYSPAFKKAWQQYYGFAWMPQHRSPEATYLSSKLKYHLYYEALKEVFGYAKTYAKSQGKQIACYVPTHSLLNYASWQIVSPEASLASLPEVDGYIAQVWTGTSREPTYFNGLKKERVFENAFLEYGCMQSMTAPTGRRMYFLSDPIEDRARSWDDYKKNYEATFTAELMYPMVDHFEVMPWPSRIYQGKFRIQGASEPQPLSPAYAAQIQTMINALNSMPAVRNQVSGSRGIGVLLSNSLMFQRFPTHEGYEDPQLSKFYGMALPLLKRGVPLDLVHMENLGFPASLRDIRVLVMSYANMKPPSAAVHIQLAQWVRRGGVLIYYGKDDDPFQGVKEWWNSEGMHFDAPSAHLFRELGLTLQPGKTAYAVGKGYVHILRKDPADLILQHEGDTAFIALIRRAYEQEAHAGRLVFKNNFVLERGPYTVAAVMDENTDTSTLTVAGPVIDLFDPQLPVLREKMVRPGEQAFLFVPGRIKNPGRPRLLCGTARIYQEDVDRHHYRFVAKSPSGTPGVLRVRLPREPAHIALTGPQGQAWPLQASAWDAATRSCLLRFENHCDGVRVDLQW